MVRQVRRPAEVSQDSRNRLQPRRRHFDHQTVRSGTANSVPVNFSCRTIKNISETAVELPSRKFFRVTSAEYRREACSFVPVERRFKKWAVVGLSNDERAHLVYRPQFSKVRSWCKYLTWFVFAILKHGQIIMGPGAAVKLFFRTPTLFTTVYNNLTLWR